MNLRVGAIADDFTGATDLANNFVRSGMRAIQTIGVPRGNPVEDVDAVVVALKSRTSPVNEAVADSLAALAWLRSNGAEQIYFKYCSTFDSTPKGNIGPVTEALMDALATDFTIANPAFPDNGRTVFNGYLFVGNVLLSESGMQNHPLTPMTDANLVRVLQAQCTRKVGLIGYRDVARGADAIRSAIASLRAEGVGIAIVDALSNDDLLRLGGALSGMPLVTAGSGVAIGLAPNFGIAPSIAAATLPNALGARAIIAGSCSQATNRQVRQFIDRNGAAFRIDPLALVEGPNVVNDALSFCAAHLERQPVLVYSTGEPDRVSAVQRRLGTERAGGLIEAALASIARTLVVDHGVRQLVVAGGETAGACVQALNVSQLRIGPQIDPGVPWCYAEIDGHARVGLHLALKSGNFGTDDFFTKAFTLLE